MNAHPTPAPASAPQRRTTTLVITAVVALLVGATLGGFGFWVATDDGGGSRAEQDMAAGCQVLERVRDELPVDPGTTSLEDPLVFELMGAASLFMATVRADESYESVSGSGQDLMAAMSRLDFELAKGATTQLQSECADR